jgi:hypothetical protein
MKRIFISLLVALSAVSSAATIQWWKTTDDSLPRLGDRSTTYALFAGMKDHDTVRVDTGVSQMSLSEWIISVGYDSSDLAGRIRIGGEPADVAYEWSEGGIPFGFHGDAFDFGLDGTGDGVETAWQVKVTETDLTIPVYYDIGFYVETDEGWDVEWFASSQMAELGYLLNNYVYPLGDLNPLTAKAWCPDAFYYSVPEPCSLGMLVLGILLLKRRT